MTDIHGVDECGIFSRPQQLLLHQGNSEEARNHGVEHSRNTERSQARLGFRSTVSTDCPRRPIIAQRQASLTEEDRSAALGIIKFNGPVHSNFVTEQARLRSFSFWPPALPQKPQELADAGFFYTGRSDQVKCFYCDGGLESWEPSDSPLQEHLKWFGDCAFVKMKIGNDVGVSREATSTKTMNATVEYQTKIALEDETNRKLKDKTIKINDPVKISSNVEGLQKEVQSLREERSCKICLEKEASIVFLPCGHLCSCENCAPALRVCAVCRAPIQGLVRTYLA